METVVLLPVNLMLLYMHMRAGSNIKVKSGNSRDGALGAGCAEVLRVALADEETVLLVSGNAVTRVGYIGDGASGVAALLSVQGARVGYRQLAHLLILMRIPYMDFTTVLPEIVTPLTAFEPEIEPMEIPWPPEQ